MDTADIYELVRHQRARAHIHPQGAAPPPIISPYVSDGVIALCCKLFRVHHVMDSLYCP
jgi:hypothetical protein